MKETLATIQVLFINIILSCFLSSCGDDVENEDENIYYDDLIGTWNCEDNYFIKDCLYFRGDGKGQYEYGNNLPTGNEKVNFSWTYPNYENRYIIVTMERPITDLEGGYVYKSQDGSLTLYYLGAMYTKVSSNVPYFTDKGDLPNDGNQNGNPPIIDSDFLCKNGGAWKYEHNSSYILSGNTQYLKSIDEVDFSRNGTIIGYFYWERSGKSGYPLAWKTAKSEVLAIGSYQVHENILNCVFSNVTCSGSSDIETKYWTPNETNYKKYKLDYEDDGTLIMSLGEEVYRLKNNGQGSNSGIDNPSETPDVTFYDAEAGTTHLKVTYKIWNKNNCGSLSNIKIYYGESSASHSISASVSGDYITALISGLSKGTKYRVKCSVTGALGTTVTEETTLSTLF